MEQGIKFVITGDTSGLEEATKKADSALSKLNGKISSLEKDIADNIRITQGYERSIEQLSKEFKSGAISQDKYAKSLDRLQRDEKETTIETANLRKELTRLRKDQKSIASLGKNTFKGMQKGAANAAPTLQEFSRVIQDAPYGIQGVGNNITQLVSQFGYLQKSAGGTKQAMKALIGSFAGPAGILFAVSTAVSLLTVYGDSLFKTTNSTKALQEQQDLLNESFDFELSLNKEVTKNLELQGKSVKNSLNDRKEILRNQLRGVDALLKQQIALLNLQKIENKTTSNWEALVLVMKDAFGWYVKFASGMADFYGEKIKEGVGLVKDLSKTWVGKLIPGIKTADQLLGIINAKLEAKKKQNKTSQSDLDKEQKLQNKVNELLAKQLEIKNEILGTNKKITGSGGRKQAEAISLDITPTIVSDPKKIAAATRGYIKKGQEIVQNPSFGSLKLPVSLGLDKNNLDSFKQLEKINFPKLDEFIKGGDKQALSFPSLKELKAGFSEYKNILSDISEEDNAIINPFSDLNIEVPEAKTDAFKKSLLDAQGASDIFKNAVGSSFNALSGVISNAMSTGNAIVDAFVSSISNSLTQLLADFVANQIAMAVLGKTQIAGEQAKANASGIVVATQGATAFGPLAPLALPGLLASTAAVINGAFAPLYAFSQGGIVPGGSFTGDKVPILANGGERILTTQDQSLLNHVLRGGYASTTNKGGGQIVEVVGQIRNETIYLANKRAGKQNRRIN